MIVREWRGMAARSNADAYPKHFRDHVVLELHLVAGFAGAQLSRRELDDKVEFLVLTRWQSSMRSEGFPAPIWRRQLWRLNAAAALVEFDTTVRHYQVLEEISA
jgi:hypothetical protein